MKRVCPNCAEFIDRKLDVCPYCHKPVKATKTKEEKPSYSTRQKNSSKTNYNDTSKSSLRKKRRSISFEEIQAIPDNSIHIETRDSIYYTSGEYSARKARGEYAPEKLKWWEIYKWADLTITRRRINKVVNRNANMPPNNLSMISMLILTILIGYTGLNHIYAKNYGRGITMMSLFVLSIGVTALSMYVPVFTKVQYSLGAFPGLIVLIMWVFDIFRVIFKKYVYKLSRLEYIKKLDIETRAKISKKYIDMSKYEFKPKKRKSYVEENNNSEGNVA